MADTTQKILSVELDAKSAIDGILKLNDAIDANNKQIALNKQAIKENNEAMKESGADTQELTAKNQDLARANEELAIQTKELTTEKRALQKEVQSEIRANSQEEGSLKSLRAQLSNLTKQYDSLSKAQRQNDAVGGKLLRQINSVTTEIKQAEEETQRYFRNVGNYPEVTESLKGSLRTLQDEIVNLTLQYREMSEEMKNSDAGVEMKARIDELTEQASEYKDIISDVKASISRGASDTFALDAAVQAGQTLTATFGLAQNAAVALGISNDSLQQSMLRMQQAMQAVQALQVIQNALQKESNLMKSIGAIQSKALAAADAIQAKAATQVTGATKMQTIAQRAYNAVARANPYVLLATGAAALAGAIFGLSSILGSNAEEERRNAEAKKAAAEADRYQQEQEEALTKAIEIGTDAVKARNEVMGRMEEAVATSVSQQVVNLDILRKKWMECGDDIQKQQEFLVKYKDELKKTGFAVNDLSTANNLLVRDYNKVVQYFDAVAKATAAAAAAMEIYKEKMLMLSGKGRSVENGGKFYGLPTGAIRVGDPSKQKGNVTQQEMGMLNKAGEIYVWIDPETNKPAIMVTERGSKMIREKREKEAQELWSATLKSLDAQYETAKQYAAKYDTQADNIVSTIGAPLATPATSPKGGGKKGTANTKKENKERVKSEEELQNMLLDITNDALNARAKEGEKYTQEWIDNQKEAIKKQGENELADAKATYDKTLAELTKSKSVLGDAKFTEISDALSKAYAIKVKAIADNTKAELEAVDAEVEKHNKEQEEKARKKAEEDLQKAKEDARKQVETMLESMPEGSRGQLEWRLRQLQNQMSEELAMYENNEQMKLAIQEKYEQQATDAQRKYAEAQMEIQKGKYEAIGKMAGGLSQILGEFADESKEAAILSKTLATAEVMIAQAVAIANAIKAAAMGSINPLQMVAQIATSVTAVTVAMIQAFKSLNAAKFATGGYIKGAGTSTSDSIPVRVSNGESIMNANTTAMFGGLLSSLNQLGGGVPIQVEQTATSVRGEDMLARAFARGVAMLPNPVVSVEDINRGQRQVEVMNERATL